MLLPLSTEILCFCLILNVFVRDHNDDDDNEAMHDGIEGEHFSILQKNTHIFLLPTFNISLY